MSTPRQDGGPAFPYAFEHDGDANISGFAPGMTLRDWFASQANEEDIISHLPITQGQQDRLFKADGIFRTRQWARYQHADAMLAARGQHSTFPSP